MRNFCELLVNRIVNQEEKDLGVNQKVPSNSGNYCLLVGSTF